MIFNNVTFTFANVTLWSFVCEIFDAEIPKSFLPPGIEAETNINFIALQFPPSAIYYYDNDTNRHVTCGLIHQLIKETAIKMKAK